MGDNGDRMIAVVEWRVLNSFEEVRSERRGKCCSDWSSAFDQSKASISFPVI